MADLAERLRRRIARDGPMPFRDWMETCLYDPQDGYYTKGMHPTGTGPGTDYATNANLHPFFAGAVAQELASEWRRQGCPGAFTVVEFGGGRGELARDALRWLDRHEAALARAVAWRHVERGGALDLSEPRTKRVARMPVVRNGAVVAHEFVDALAMDWFEFRDGVLQEVHVGAEGERFVEVLRPAPLARLETAPAAPLVPGQRIVGYPFVRPWLAEVAGRLQKGAVLVMDYGDVGRRLWTPEHMDGSVRGFRDHTLIADVLGSPGQTDMTAHVDFDLTRRWAEEAGLTFAQEESQEEFVLRHGILDALNATQRTTQQGASAYLRLRQLLLPTGLGGPFRMQRFTTG